MSQDARSVEQIEADIVATRARLASTVDELKYRTQPKVIAQRQLDSVKAKAKSATHTPEGDLRVERIAAVAAAVVVVVAGIVLLKRRG